MTVRPRALFISSGPPFPPHIGGHQRTDLVLRALTQRFEVDALVLDLKDNVRPEARAYLAERCARVEYRLPARFDEFRPWGRLRPLLGRYARSIAYRVGSPLHWVRIDPAIAELIARMHAERGYSVTLSRYLLRAHRSGAVNLPDVRHVLDSDDVELTVAESKLHEIDDALRRSPGPAAAARLRFRRALLRRDLRHLRRALPDLYRRYHHAFLCSEADRAVFDAILASRPPASLDRPGPSRSILANIPWTAPGGAITPLPPAPDSAAAIAVVGSWSWLPNAEGLHRFLDNAWPIIRKARPDATLRVVGSGMDAPFRERLQRVPGVVAVGFVDAVADAYRDAALVVAPVYTGGGTKLKVAEAAAHARACACTEHAYRGYEQVLDESAHVLVGRTDDLLARHCIDLLNDPARRNRIGRDAAHRVAERLSWSAFSRIVAQGCDPQPQTDASGHAAPLGAASGAAPGAVS